MILLVLRVICNMSYVINRIDLQEVYECKINSCNHIILDKNSLLTFKAGHRGRFYPTHFLYHRNMCHTITISSLQNSSHSNSGYGKTFEIFLFYSRSNLYLYLVLFLGVPTLMQKITKEVHH